jgi:hypothetical protein
MSGLQSFLDVQAPPLARPPGCSYRRSTGSSGQPGRVRHAKNVWLPTTHCGIATCLNRAIGTTGLTPVRLRPSRPLHARNGTVFALTAIGKSHTSSERQNPISLKVSSHNWFSHMSFISSLVKSTSFLFLIHRRRLLITRGHVFKMNSFPAMTFRGTK